MNNQKFIKFSEGFFIDADYAKAFEKLHLTSIDAVFEFKGNKNLHKDNLAKHRSRIEFDSNNKTFFLKRYDAPGVWTQIRNWAGHCKHASMSAFDRLPTDELARAGIKTPKTIAYGEQWNGIFEKRSFIITEKIADAESLERKLPPCFYDPNSAGNVSQRLEFIKTVADFARRFHETGFRHRDFYLAHVFLTVDGQLYLIDLQRTFKPILTGWRFRVKDITQLYYSAPGQYVSRSDRLRFYQWYVGRKKLNLKDKLFIRRLKAKAWRMADHDIMHGRSVPFAM